VGATPIIAPPAPVTSPDGRAAFRPDIAGLRGVAVGAVVLYHAGVPFLGGGFVGVDVFFVISGFLMARLTVAEHARTGTVRIGAFYAWRIRRLLPMAAVVLAATLAAARLFVPPLLWPELSRVARSVAVYLTNYQLAAGGTDYLASSEPSPFQHYWSLAVEEQFYLFWPLLLLVVLRRRRRWPAPMLAAATAGSFALCVVQVVSSQPMAFFGLPARAWEFGVGALCALLPAGERSSPRWAAVAGWVALALIGTAAVLYGPTVVYPGWASLPPVAGTGMILVAGRSGARGPILLRVAPMPWLGRISYSLYLWHWPLLVVPTLATGEDLGGPARAALVLAAVALAGLSERYIERPFRRNAFRLGTWTTLAGAAGVTALALVASVAVATLPTLAEPVVAGPSSAASAEGTQVVPADVTPALRDVAADLPVVYRDGCHLDIASTVPALCRFGAPAGARRVMLLGDSHAAVWFPALETAAIDDRWSLTSLSKTACPLVDVPVEQVALRRPYVECEIWKANVVRRVWAERPNLIVLSAYSPAFRSLMLAPGDFDRTWADGLRRMIGLLPPGTAVVVLGDTPDWPRPPVDCLSGALDHARDCARPTTELTDGALRRRRRPPVHRLRRLDSGRPRSRRRCTRRSRAGRCAARRAAQCRRPWRHPRQTPGSPGCGSSHSSSSPLGYGGHIGDHLMSMTPTVTLVAARGPALLDS